MTPDTPSRPTTVLAELKVKEAKVGFYLRIIVGLLFMIGGIAVFIYGVVSDAHKLMIGGFSTAVVAAMSLPSVFDAVKPVFVFIFPNGLPLIGGRRASDPPAAPPAVPPEVPK